ncbi:MAG: hypothetical protein MI861_20985, partial [Pirellulales bacterium]|nr:hypothetical protein [Pirellulales bacterium]
GGRKLVGLSWQKNFIALSRNMHTWREAFFTETQGDGEDTNDFGALDHSMRVENSNRNKRKKRWHASITTIVWGSCGTSISR